MLWSLKNPKTQQSTYHRCCQTNVIRPPASNCLPNIILEPPLIVVVRLLSDSWSTAVVKLSPNHHHWIVIQPLSLDQCLLTISAWPHCWTTARPPSQLLSSSHHVIAIIRPQWNPRLLPNLHLRPQLASSKYDLLTYTIKSLSLCRISLSSFYRLYYFFCYWK